MRSPETVLFLCPHGGAKSVLAAAYFNSLAVARKAPYVAVPAAVEEPYPEVPAPVAELLERENVRGRPEAVGLPALRPRRAEAADFRAAVRVVSIACDADALAPAGVAIERWDDVPRVDDDLAAAAAAIRTHVSDLVDRLDPGWREFLAAMARIAANSFGGPVAQIGVVHDEVVERRRWIDDGEFGRALAFANALPGPEALELVIHVGYLKRGIGGGIVAGLFFIAPGVASLTLLGWLYARYGSLPAVSTIAAAIRPVAVALVAAAAFRLARKLLDTSTGLALAAAALLAGRFLSARFVAVLLAGAVLGGIVPRAPTLAGKSRALFAAALVAIAVALGAAVGPLESREGIAPATAPERATLGDVAAFNLKTALVTFGGAYTALPYMREQAVGRFGWVSEGAMLDALALGETTPGPLISIGVFVSYLAAGLPGALVGSFFLFLPSFVLVLALARHVDRILSAPGIARALEGVVAATIGLILALTVDVVGRIDGPLSAVLAAGAFVAVTALRASPALVVLVAVIGALVAHAGR